METVQSCSKREYREEGTMGFVGLCVVPILDQSMDLCVHTPLSAVLIRCCISVCVLLKAFSDTPVFEAQLMTPSIHN